MTEMERIAGLLLGSILLGLFLLVQPVGMNAQVYEYDILDPLQPDFTAEVRCVYQDPTGFLWLGTDRGLWRFDGEKTTVVASDLEPSPSLSALLWHRDTLYAGSTSGILYALVPQGTLEALASAEGYPTKPISALCADVQGRLWMGTAGEGLYLRQGRRWYQTSEADGLPSNQINALIADEQEGVWAGTDRGLVHVNQRTSQRHITPLRRGGSNPDAMVTALMELGQNNFLVGYFSGGMGTFRSGDSQTVPVGTSEDWVFGQVTRMVNSAGRWWIGTASYGLLETDPQSGVSQPIRLSGRGQVPSVQHLLALREGRILSVNQQGQLYSFDPRRQAAFERGSLYGETQAIIECRDGWVWFSTLQGLFRFRPNVDEEADQVELIGLPDGAVIVSMFEDSEGFLWIGTFDYGAYRIAPGQLKAQHIPAGSLQDPGSVLCIREWAGLMWLGTLSGVYAWEAGSKTALFTDLGIGRNFVYSLNLDYKGGMWIGADGAGAYYLSHSQIPALNSSSEERSAGALLRALLKVNPVLPSTLPGVTVYQVLRDSNGRLWFHTRERGLLAEPEIVATGNNGPSPEPVNHFGAPEEVMAIALDPEGMVVLLHERSAHWMPNPKEPSRPVDLQELRDRPRPMSNAMATGGNRLWFGTNSGPFSLQGSLDDLQAAPVVSLSLAKAAGKAFAAGSEVPGGRRLVEFFFSAPWIGTKDAVIYEYTLQTVGDEEWRLSQDEWAFFNNLQPGNYTFKLRARLKDSAQAGPELAFAFTIPRPLYAQPWFLVLCLLATAAALAYWVRLREKRLRRLEEGERDKIRTQYELLRNQVNPHFLFNSFNTLSGLIEEDPARAQTYVERLSGFFRNVLTQRQEDCIPLHEELRILDDYLSIQRARYEDNLVVNIDVPAALREMALPPMTLQILVENALKHNVISRNHPMQLCIRQGPRGGLEVANTRKARPSPAEGTGLGLENLSRKLQLIGAPPLIIERSAELFSVEVPLVPYQSTSTKYASTSS